METLNQMDEGGTPAVRKTDLVKINTAPALKRIKVIVTPTEIAFATKANSKHCMITDSMKRDYGKRFNGIVTSKEYVAFTEKKTRRRYKFPLPPIARAALLRFDAGESVEPVEFTLKNPMMRERKQRARKEGHLPALVGESSFGNHPAQMAGAKNTQRRISLGIDRIFGSRLFKSELDALRAQLQITTQ